MVNTQNRTNEERCHSGPLQQLDRLSSVIAEGKADSR